MKLAVHFYSFMTGQYCGEGFYMPSMEFFHNTYVPEHFPDAENLGGGKYLVNDKRDIIVCEESEMRRVDM